MAILDCGLLQFILCFVVFPAAALYVLLRFVLRLTKPQVEAFFFYYLCGWLHRRFFSREKALLFDRMYDLKKNTKNGLSILEIGVGSGMNFAFYPEGTLLTALEPNPYHEAYFKANLESSGSHVKLVRYVQGFAEDMSSIESDTFDAVVCTLTLCSVRDPAEVLTEVKRVLKPGGTFFYLEHVAGEHGSFIRHIQNIIQFIWPHHHDHAHSHRSINRETWVYLDNAGFREVQYRHFSVNTWIVFFAKPCLYGTALK